MSAVSRAAVAKAFWSSWSPESEVSRLAVIPDPTIPASRNAVPMNSAVTRLPTETCDSGNWRDPQLRQQVKRMVVNGEGLCVATEWLLEENPELTDDQVAGNLAAKD